MNADQQWQKLKDNYLKQVEDALSPVKSEKRSTILEDVRHHLEDKYAELPPDKQNWEGFQHILIDMGPPADYAELLNPVSSGTKKNVRFHEILMVAFVLLLAATCGLLIYLALPTPSQTQQSATNSSEVEKDGTTNNTQPTDEAEISIQEPDKLLKQQHDETAEQTSVAFIIRFQSSNPQQFQTAGELLSSFNENHPPDVHTHHYRTRIDDDQLVGTICVDSISDADAVKEMLRKNQDLAFIDVQPVTETEFEQYCSRYQALPLEISEQSPSVSKPKTPIPPENPVLGKWLAVDCVKNIKYFVPGHRMYKKQLILDELYFTREETVYWNFKNGVVKKTSFNNNTFQTVKGQQAKYLINQINGQDYLFIEWITPEVTKEGTHPDYYVLRRQQEHVSTLKTLQRHQSRSVGHWVTVDFVRNIDDFRPTQRQWHGDLYLKELTIYGDGTTSGPWIWQQNYLWHPGDRTKAQITIQTIKRETYLFMEWMSGDVTDRGLKPRFYVLKKARVQANDLSPKCRVTFGASYCNADYVRSILGNPSRVDMNGRKLCYDQYGFALLYSSAGVLSEVHLNRGYQGQLETGISLNSTKQEVLRTYGQPLHILQADDLHRKNDDRVLYRKGNASRIYYGQLGLIFWFNGDEVNQIVPFKGSLWLSQYP